MAWLAHNLVAWMVQTVVFATVAALLPILLRVRHPKTQLYYCHAALVFCLILPVVQPWRTPAAAVASRVPWLWIVLAAGALFQLLSVSGGLLKIRRYRIAATPLYPVPDAMRAASAITQADALFCVSEDAAGPVMMGWLAPVVLLPPAILDLDEEAQCGIACHELLHVRRGDWMITLIEELAGALLWFNPGAWLLLSEAKLAREQLVDAESVRLTASREPYIDALMAMARAHTWSDLVPAPSFLRRSHLTQRMQSLLSDAPASTARVAASYGSILLLLGCSVWATCAAFPMVGKTGAVVAQVKIASVTPAALPPQLSNKPRMFTSNLPPVTSLPQVPAATSVPAVSDPREPIAPGTEVATSTIERSAAMALLARARQRALRHVLGTPPYRFTVAFQAAGSVMETGPGELTETWINGQRWNWTANLGGISHIRLRVNGQLLEDRHIAVIPMRAHMLRTEVLWATRGLANGARLRAANIEWQGKSATCLLISQSDTPEVAGRSWDEEEYCMDDATATLVVHSIAPGTYTVFTYGGAAFHNYALADRIQIYVNGAVAVDASFRIEDATQADAASLTPTPGMTGTPEPVGIVGPYYASVRAATGDATQPVVVHAEIDGDGKVVETELSAAANPALFPAAIERIRTIDFGQTGTERQAYINVWF